LRLSKAGESYYTCIKRRHIYIGEFAVGEDLVKSGFVGGFIHICIYIYALSSAGISGVVCECNISSKDNG